MKKIIFIFLALFLFTASPVWACAAGDVCIANDGWPGTCQDDGSCTKNADADGTCTSDPSYTPRTVSPGTGIISVIINDIQNQLTPLAQRMFNGITSNSGFINAATAALILFVIFYAISFTFGMVQLTTFDFMIRMVKISVVALLIHQTAWANADSPFALTFVRFFNDSTNDIIMQVSNFSIAGSGNSAYLGGSPFDWMDNAIIELTSTKMLVMLMAAATTGFYGVVVIILLTVALYTFLMGILQAMWVYLMSLVLRTLLLGLAPLFLACILFSRTRQLFDGWLNQLLNSCLQPIFLFIFFAFFVQLIKSCLDQLLNLNVCWTETGFETGAPSQEYFWRFALYNCTDGRWEPFKAIWGLTGADSIPADSAISPGACGRPSVVHPVGIMLPLTLWILSDLAKRFNEIVVRIAQDIANASTSFAYRGGGFGDGNSGAGGGQPAAGGGSGVTNTGKGATQQTPGGGVLGSTLANASSLVTSRSRSSPPTTKGSPPTK